MEWTHPNLILKVMREKEPRLQSDPIEITSDNEWDRILIRLPWMQAQLQQMPGCCAVLTASYIRAGMTEKAYLRALDFITESAYEAGFGSVILTQVVYPDEWHWWNSLPERGWVISKPFINAKSGNKVVYLTLDLKQPGFRKEISSIKYKG